MLEVIDPSGRAIVSQNADGVHRTLMLRARRKEKEKVEAYLEGKPAFVAKCNRLVKTTFFDNFIIFVVGVAARSLCDHTCLCADMMIALVCVQT